MVTCYTHYHCFVLLLVFHLFMPINNFLCMFLSISLFYAFASAGQIQLDNLFAFGVNS